MMYLKWGKFKDDDDDDKKGKGVLVAKGHRSTLHEREETAK